MKSRKLRFGTVGTPAGAPGSGTLAAVKHIRKLELSALELGWVRSVRVSDNTCERIRKTAQSHDVRLSVHAPYYINLNSRTSSLMKKSDARILAAARKGFTAGAGNIVFHPGSYHAQPAETVYERARRKLTELTQILREEGTDVILRPETMGKGSMFGSLDEVLELSRDVKGVAPCIDISHLHARTGDGGFNSYGEFSNMFRRVREVLGKSALKDMHFHVSGIEYTASGEKKHLMLEESDLRWMDFIRACVKFRVEGTVLCESPKQEVDAVLLRDAFETAIN